MVRSVASALGWVLLSLLSLTVGAIALLTVLALAKNARTEAAPAFLWALALLLTFGLPFGLAAWKHLPGKEATRKIQITMTWLPAVWNAAFLLLATQLIPDVTATALRRVEWVVQGRFGDSHPATRAMSAFGHEVADELHPEPVEIPETLDPVSLDPERALTVPLGDQGTAIMLDVGLEGPSGQLTARYVFDTGASFTTITEEMARQLGIIIPEDAPTLVLNTASGPRERRMVFLPKLELQDIEIDGLLVSICDACATDRVHGLLGLNVIREFVVQMEHAENRMQLIPRVHEAEPNRAYDIEHISTLEVDGRPEIWLGRVRWIINIKNRGTVPIRNVVPQVEFHGGPTLMGERIESIAPGETAKSLVVGKVSEDEPTDSVEFAITLAEAYW